MLAFVLDFLLCIAFIYLPGLILLTLMRCNLLSTVTLAPLPTLAYYALAAQVFASAHIPASGLSLGGSCLALFLLVGLLVHYFKKQPLSLLSIQYEPIRLFGRFHVPFSLVCIIVFLCLGLGFYSYLFCRNAGSPDMFLQNYDNVTHLTYIRLFADTGSYNSLSAGLYDFSEDPATRPTTYTGSFYPSLWHSLGAMVFGLVGDPLTTLVNALNGVFVSLVFPLSMLAFFAALFPNKPNVILCGSLTVVAFEAFPWGYLTFGPLYPNLASLAILPAVWALFILALRNALPTNERVFSWILFGCGFLNIIFLQPNALFTSIIGLSAFCVYKILREPPAWKSLGSKSRRRLWAFIFIAFVIAFWFICYNLPFFANVVTFDNWRAIAAKRQVIIDVLTLALADCPSQLCLGALVIIGCIQAWKEPHLRWTVVSYVLFALFYAVCASFEGTIKHLMCGFWYCDPFRLAAHMVLLGAPLAAVGFAACIDTLRKRLVVKPVSERRTHGPRRERRLQPHFLAPLVVCLTSVILIFYPNFSLKGFGDIQTAFGFYEEKVQLCANDSPTSKSMLPTDEQRFLEKVAELVPEGALILNHPYDGSVFGYGLDGLNLYYRYVIDYGLSDETEASLTIRNNLSALASDAKVAHAVASTGADYLLLLDVNNPKMKSQAFDVYQPEGWSGITNINDSTEGFIPILSEGDMRLYRIDPTKVSTNRVPTERNTESTPISTNSDTSQAEQPVQPDQPEQLDTTQLEDSDLSLDNLGL